MATTVQAANLNVTITENVSLGNKAWGNNIVNSFAAQGEVDQRIMNIAVGSEGSFTTILNLLTVDSAGQVVVANFGYFRITNLDDTNYIMLQLYKDANEMSYHKLEAGESFVLMSPDMAVTCELPEALPGLGDISSIKADANTAACDIEYLIVTTGAAE